MKKKPKIIKAWMVVKEYDPYKINCEEIYSNKRRAELMKMDILQEKVVPCEIKLLA